MTEKKAARVRDYVGHIIVAITCIEAYVEGLDRAAFVETTLVQGFDAERTRSVVGGVVLCVDRLPASIGIELDEARRHGVFQQLCIARGGSVGTEER
jgi:hypothetical protein